MKCQESQEVDDSIEEVDKPVEDVIEADVPSEEEEKALDAVEDIKTIPKGKESKYGIQ